MTHPRTAGHHIHPGHFSMKIPGQLSMQINMLGTECGYMLSRGANGLHIASVILPNSQEEVSASGASAGIAMVGAIALAIVEREHDRLKERTQIDTFG